MTKCSDIKHGDVLVCADCGLELKVTKECQGCSCESQGLMCCGNPLIKKAKSY
ncbi:MAG: hypothetical protein JXJ22_02225 [Bacteroidales bacterium]|nr:hypothetical protein [Bacteroidales bacterium]